MEPNDARGPSTDAGPRIGDAKPLPEDLGRDGSGWAPLHGCLRSKPYPELLHGQQDDAPDAEVRQLGQDLAQSPLRDAERVGSLLWP